ncbi:proteasome subunit beta type-3-like [Ctenocephalides felis]|uniref:proteasome subunit beta type-3-like n=1 Tax=Ctenocephalides felis TaxID=7515 RepID=UPI000E6E1A44|nr:proteasome subunit beta type-3-like [Ctenocephalides felis]
MAEQLMGAVIAMAGDQCVAIASDHRYGRGSITLATNYEKVFQVGKHLFLGIAGIPTDSERILKRMRFRKNVYEVNESRIMTPQVYAKNLSNILYEARFSPYMVEPVIAGLEYPGKLEQLHSE